MIVDDGSTDDTIAIAGQLAARDPRVHLVVHASNRGYGEALRSGIAAASLPWVLMIDADLQLDVAELENFLAPAASADFVIGWRILMQGSAGHRLGGAVWRRFVANALDLPFADVDCAYRLVRLDLLRRLDLHAEGALAGAELLVKSRAAGARIAEVQVHHRARVAGRNTGVGTRMTSGRCASCPSCGAAPASGRCPAPAVSVPGTVSPGMTSQTLDILVCDDDSSLREALRQSFERAGHRVLAVADGRSAIDRASTQHFDVVLLDVSLGPGSPDGYEVCRELRERRNGVAVIMLTALDSEADAVLGPRGRRRRLRDQAVPPGRAAQPDPRGAARALPGRRRSRLPGAAARARLELDPGVRLVQRDGQPVDLTFSEFEILHALMAQRHRVHSRHELLRAVWGDSAYRDPRSVDVHIRHLREKLETHARASPS